MSKRIERINWIDVAKAIGILLIVLSHTLKNGLLRQAIFSFHVPLFFFLSGLTYHGVKKGVWKKRFFRLYLPYIIFSIVSIMVFAVAAHFWSGLQDVNVGIGKGIIGMLYGNARTGNMKWNEPLWFVPCLIAVYALADIIELGLSNVKPSVRFGGGITGKNIIRISIAILLLVISFILGKYARTVMLPFGLESALFAFVFFQIGVIINQRGLTTQLATAGKNKVMMVTVAVALLAAMWFISTYNGFAQVKALTFGKSIFCFLATSFLGIIAVVVLSVLVKNTPWLLYIGQHTLPILLMHKFPILFFQMIIRPVGRLLEQGDSVAGIICAVIVGAFTVALCLIANLIIEKVFPIAVGKGQIKRSVS